jgi:hypothetical protein
MVADRGFDFLQASIASRTGAAARVDVSGHASPAPGLRIASTVADGADRRVP